jgi:transposase-like protein
MATRRAGNHGSCTVAARRVALDQRGLKCPGCGSYEVVPKKGREGRYVCCGCGKSADFFGWVRVSHR